MSDDEREDETRTADPIELIAAVFADVLWELHKRALATYGPEVASVLEPEEDESQECLIHTIAADTGRCLECGYTPFLDGKS